jgi:hypothetical protein
MNARFNPPLGGFLYFLRPGSIKLPWFVNLPVLGGNKRTWLDVGLFVALLAVLIRALVAPAVTPEMLLPAMILVPILGVADRTTFLAARSEHFFAAMICLFLAQGDAAATPWVAGCKVVWLCIWFWAGVSKLNDHFPSVIMVMMNNGPFFPKALKRRLFVNYPNRTTSGPRASRTRWRASVRRSRRRSR